MIKDKKVKKRNKNHISFGGNKDYIFDNVAMTIKISIPGKSDYLFPYKTQIDYRTRCI